MRLLRDLWATSPRRTATVALLIVLVAGGQTAAAALAGPVLLDRSYGWFAVLAIALLMAVIGDLAVGLRRLTATSAESTSMATPAGHQTKTAASTESNAMHEDCRIRTPLFRISDPTW